jgi:hypothetical protein
MIAEAKKRGARTVTPASMNTYYMAYLTDWVVDYYEEQGLPATGDWPNHYYVFQELDERWGLGLWDWWTGHTTTALSNWPVLGDFDGVIEYRWGNDDHASVYFQNNLLTMRTLCPEYIWIYDECSCWELDSYVCNWPPGETTNTSLPCPGLIMAETIPDQPCQHQVGKWVGIMTYTIKIEEEGDYYVYARIAPQKGFWRSMNYYVDESDTGFLLIVDNSCPILMGDELIYEPEDGDLEWKWVDYAEGDQDNKVIFHLTARTHVVKIVGYRFGLHVDRLIFTTSNDVFPVGTGGKYFRLFFSVGDISNIIPNTRDCLLI